MTRRLFAIMLALLVAAAATPIQAQDAPELGMSEDGTLSPVLQQMLDQALAADEAQSDDDPGDYARLVQAVDLALTAFPGLAEQIEQEALAKLAADTPSAQAARAEIATLVASTIAARPPAPPPPAPPARAWLDPRGWDGSIELGGNFTTGNTEEQGLNIAIILERLFAEAFEHRLQIDFNFAQSFGERTQQRLFASHQFFYRGWNRAFAFTFVSYEDDEFDGFQYRAVQNAGLGYTVFDGDRFHWDVELGPGVRQTVTDAGDFDLEILGRTSSRFEWTIRDGVVFTDTTTVIFGEETTAENTAAISIKLLNALSLNLSHYFQFDTNTPGDAENIDTISKATISYRF